MYYLKAFVKKYFKKYMYKMEAWRRRESYRASFHVHTLPCNQTEILWISDIPN